jgi:hypothetical protein
MIKTSINIRSNHKSSDISKSNITIIITSVMERERGGEGERESVFACVWESERESERGGCERESERGRE